MLFNRVISKVKSKQELERQRSLRSTNSQVSNPSVLLLDQNAQKSLEHISSSALTFPSAPPTARREYAKQFSDATASNNALSQDSTLVYEIANAVVQDVPNVAWNDSNRLYLLFEYHQPVQSKIVLPTLHPILFKTFTIEQSQKMSYLEWKGHIAAFPVFATSNQVSTPVGHDCVLKVFVYHECLAIQDKLVGLCEIKLSQDMNTTTQQVTTDLFDSTNIIKRKRKGIISFDVLKKPGIPTQSNVSPRLAEDSKCSASQYSIMTKYVDVNDHQPEDVNGFSPSVILAAADALQAWEHGQESPHRHNEKPIQVPKTNNGQKTTKAETTNSTISTAKGKLLPKD